MTGCKSRKTVTCSSFELQLEALNPRLGYGDMGYGDTIRNPLSCPPRRLRLWSGLSLVQAAAESLFSRRQEGCVAERTAVAAETLEAGEFGLLARRHFQKFAKARRNIEKRPYFDERIVPSFEMGAHARPFPFARLCAEPGAHRIEGEIARGFQHMGFVHRDAAEPALKKIPGDARAGVDEGGIAPMRLAVRARQPFKRRWRQNEMDVIGQQAIGPAGDAVLLASLGEQIAIQRIIAGLREQLLAPVAALRDVMGNVGNDNAGKTGHGAAQHGSRDSAMCIMSP